MRPGRSSRFHRVDTAANRQPATLPAVPTDERLLFALDHFAGSGQGFCVHRAEGKRCAALDLGAGNGPLALGLAWPGTACRPASAALTTGDRCSH